MEADWFYNSILINNGKTNFSIKALPWQAQLAPYRTAVAVNANNDNLPDIFLGGNFFENNIQMGRYDADMGTLLINKGKNNLQPEVLNGLQIKGEIRHIVPVTINNRIAYIVAKNNDSTIIVQFKK